MDNWISVLDKLPIEEDAINGNYDTVEVIVFNENTVESMEFMAGNIGEFWSQFNTGNETITHWQPLPNPPETK